MRVFSVPFTPFPDQRPGTSGLRKKVPVFRQPCYVEAFVQSMFDALPEAVGEGVAGKTLVLGGDGRFFNAEAAQIILRMMAGERRRPRAGRPRWAAVDAGGRARSSAAAARSAASCCPRATIPAAPTAISASSTMSPMAARRRSAVTEAIYPPHAATSPPTTRSKRPTCRSTASARRGSGT